MWPIKSDAQILAADTWETYISFAVAILKISGNYDMIVGSDWSQILKKTKNFPGKDLALIHIPLRINYFCVIFCGL